MHAALNVAFTQHRGLNGASQQDALLINACVFQSLDLLPRTQASALPAFFAVADGLAISPAAHLASRLVLAFLQRRFVALQAESQGEVVDKLRARDVRQAQQALAAKLGRGATRGAACTFVSAVCQGERIRILHVGDCRAYHRSAGGVVRQLTRDHNVANAIDYGNFAGSAAGQGLMHYLSADPLHDDFEVQMVECPFHVGDSLLLCSDGVHEPLAAQLNELLVAELSPLQRAEQLRAAVLGAGALDNFSLIVIQRE